MPGGRQGVEENGAGGAGDREHELADDAVSTGQVRAGPAETATFGQRLEGGGGVRDVLTGAQALRRRPRDRFEAGVEPGEWGEWEPEVTSGAGDGRGSG